jgi:hypothetical protein
MITKCGLCTVHQKLYFGQRAPNGSQNKQRLFVQTNNLVSVMEINCTLCKEENECFNIISIILTLRKIKLLLTHSLNYSTSFSNYTGIRLTNSKQSELCNREIVVLVASLH